MRRQYLFRPSANGFDAWDVHRLVDLSRALPVIDIPLDAIAELDTPYWFGADGAPMTVRVLVRHLALVRDADPAYPIILDVDGTLMDGMHRVAKALLEGRSTIAAVRLTERPEPDYRDVQPDELDY